MRSALDVLAELGAASGGAFWLPILAWTLLALAVEAALRLGRVSARTGTATRGALVALLPLGLVGPPLLARWVPSVRPAPAPLADAPIGATATPEAWSAPEAFVGDLPAPEVLAPAPLDLALGSLTVAVVVLGVVALCVLAGGLVWIARYRQRLPAADDAVRDQALALARRMGVGPRLAVSTVGEAVSPFTVGLWRPLVALPADLTPEARALALAHELAHVRGAHFGWAVGERIVRAAFVWHPLVHVLGRGLALDREREADAAVLGLWPERAAEYGRLLHALASRPSPRLSLGASSSPLLSRLHAMTRLTPERRRLARLTGAMLLVLPLLASAAVLPDAPQQAFLPPTEAPAPPPAPDAAPLAPEAPPEAPEAPPEAPEASEMETPLPPEAPVASADTLIQFMAERQVWNSDGDMRVRLRLKNSATYEIAEAIANYYSAGDEAGELTVVGNGFQIQRSTLRKDALPPPPPPPPPPSAPEAPRPIGDLIQLGNLSVAMTTEELDRYADVLRAELQSATEELNSLEGKSDFESQEKRMRLEIRLREVQGQYRQIIEGQEQRRLRDLRDGIRGND